MHATLMDGRNVTEKRIVLPKPLEIAIAMGRICRYAGQLPCNLITHSLLVAWFAWKTARFVHPQHTKKLERRKRWMTTCWALLHDVHEVVTGDIMSKDSSQDMFQGRIDVRLAREYRIKMRYVDWDLLHEADMTARFVEVKTYGGDKMLAKFSEVSECERPMSEEWLQTAQKFIRNANWGNMNWMIQPENTKLLCELSYAAREFVKLLKMIKAGRRSKVCDLIVGIVEGAE